MQNIGYRQDSHNLKRMSLFPSEAAIGEFPTYTLHIRAMFTLAEQLMIFNSPSRKGSAINHFTLVTTRHKRRKRVHQTPGLGEAPGQTSQPGGQCGWTSAMGLVRQHPNKDTEMPAVPDPTMRSVRILSRSKRKPVRQ